MSSIHVNGSGGNTNLAMPNNGGGGGGGAVGGSNNHSLNGGLLPLSGTIATIEQQSHMVSPPASACSLPCAAGMIRKQQGDTCCWICDQCEDFEFVFDEFTCRPCPAGHWPFSDQLACYPLPVKHIAWNSAFAIVPLVISAVGIAVTLVVIYLFVLNNDTPLVRASGRELSYMLLAGILVCFCNTFALLARPSLMSCVMQRFGIGVGFSIIYGALLTKTNRISRIFYSASKSAQRPNYISPSSQVCITCSLIGNLLFILYDYHFLFFNLHLFIYFVAQPYKYL